MADDKDTKKDKETVETADGTKLEVIAGPEVEKRPVDEQAKEARGDKDPKADDGGKVDGAVKAAAEKATTPEMEIKDAAKESRVEHLKTLGIDAENPPAGPFKVGETVGKEKLYKGEVTVTSVSGEYDNSKISTRINIGPVPRGLDWLKYAFKQHFPSANTDEMFEVDPDNKEDPLLRTKFG